MTPVNRKDTLQREDRKKMTNPQNEERFPLKLDFQQQAVLEALRGKETKEYPLGDWYLGAIYALKNHHNPDCVSQAAQSLRELLEKLPRVVLGMDVQVSSSGFKGMRRDLYERFSKDKKRYHKEWKGKKIDGHLAKTLGKIDRYLELNRQPTRKEMTQKAIEKIDPMAIYFDIEIQEQNRNRLHSVLEKMEGYAHHKTSGGIADFEKCLKTFEILILELLAPITTQDQQEIRSILQRSVRLESDEERLLLLIKRRGANFVFFFKEVADSSWIPILEKKGYFAHPPSLEPLGDGRVNVPFWPPLSYLVRIFDSEPEKVLKILENLPETDNPQILEGIVDVVLKSDSADVFHRLAPRIMTYVETWWRFRYDRVIKLLQKPYLFDKSIESLSSLLLLKVIEFRSVPQSEEEKQERRNKEPENQHVFADPSPRFDNLEYREIMDKGVCPLAEKEPWMVARILIDATASMIRMTMHQRDMDETGVAKRYEIFSDRALDGADYTYMDSDSKWCLVQAMKFSCEKVFEKSPGFIDLLNESLYNQRWKVFRHIREHLYTLYPNEQTKPWIRELILEHKNYNWNYSYHFQKMIRNACEHFGAKLLSEKELERILETICNGPSQESSRKRMGEQCTEEEFKKDQRRLHRLLLRPFASVLFGEYLSYFQELENEAKKRLSDKNYLHSRLYGGKVKQRSPKPQEELAKMTDEELLDYINEWK